MGYYPPNTGVSTLPLRPVMDACQMFKANLARTSQALPADRSDAQIMLDLGRAQARSKTRKDWVQARAKILGAWDLVIVRKDGPAVIRWAR